MPETQDQTSEIRIHRLSTIPNLGSGDKGYLARISAAGRIAAVVGILAGVALALASQRFMIENRIWKQLPGAGGSVYFWIVGFFVWALTFVVVGCLARCFPTVGSVNRHEADLRDAVLGADGVPLHLNSIFASEIQHPGLLLRTRIGKLWNSFLRGAAPSDLRTQNEQLSALDGSVLSAAMLPLEVSMWAMPVLGFIGTVVGATAAVGGLAGSVGNVVTKGQLNTETMPFLNAAFQGLAVAFDTTFVGLVGLTVVGSLRWLIFKSGDAAISYVDTLGEDFISTLSYEKDENKDEEEDQADTLSNRVSRMALDLWRSGHKTERFIEERVLDVFQHMPEGVLHLTISCYPHLIGWVENNEQEGCVLRLHRLTVGRSDGLFLAMRFLGPPETCKVPKALAQLVALDERGFCVFPESETKLGVMWLNNSNASATPQPLTSLPSGLVLTGASPAFTKSLIRSASRPVFAVRKGNTELCILPKAPLENPSTRKRAKHTGLPEHGAIEFEELPGKLLCADHGSPFLVVQDVVPNSVVRIVNSVETGRPTTTTYKEINAVAGVLSSQIGTVCLATSDKRLHRISFDSGRDARQSWENNSVIIEGSCCEPVTRLGLLGGRSHFRIVYLQENEQLFACEPRTGRRELLLSHCKAMTVSRDSKYMVTFDPTDGLRVWGYRPEGS